MAWPIVVGDVQGHLGVLPAGVADQNHLARVTAAAVRFVERHVPAEERGADTELGAVMLAARLYGRRGSALGVATFGEMGGMYVQRYDPDIYSMLGLDRPAVG